jgi:hypothetical protein
MDIQLKGLFMKCICRLALISTLCFSMAHASDSNAPTGFSSQQYQALSSTFTNASNYNSFNFGGNPLGRLVVDSNLVSMDAAYRMYNQTQDNLKNKYNGFIIPSLTLRPSKALLFNLNYSLNSVTIDPLSLPLHKFGFTMLGQTNNAVFQAGIAGDGFIGTVTEKNESDSRTILGIRNTGICIGSTIVPEVTLGVFAHASFLLDTLHISENPSQLQERFASVTLPQIDVTADIIIPSIKNKILLGYTFSKSHFVYTIKSDNPAQVQTFHNVTGNNDMLHQWDADPIVTDSMAIAFQDQISFDIGKTALKPSLTTGYLQSSSKRMNPGSSNHPLTYDGVKEGYNWKTNSFKIGVGTSFSILDMSNTWIEFSYSSLKLQLLGDKFAESLDDTRKTGLTRLGLGTEFDFASIPAFNINQSTDLRLSLGYFQNKYNPLLSTYRDELFSHILPNTVNTQLTRYTPWEQFNKTVTLSGIHTGLHTSFKEETIAADLYFVFANEKFSDASIQSGKVTELGIDITFNIKSQKK